MAHDQHHLACPVTEPYGSRFDAITGHRRHQGDRARGDAAAGPPSSPRPRGSLDAQWLLIDAEAWTSAVRTARAGGTGWGMNGPVED